MRLQTSPWNTSSMPWPGKKASPRLCPWSTTPATATSWPLRLGLRRTLARRRSLPRPAQGTRAWSATLSPASRPAAKRGCKVRAGNRSREVVGACVVLGAYKLSWDPATSAVDFASATSLARYKSAVSGVCVETEKQERVSREGGGLVVLEPPARPRHTPNFAWASSPAAVVTSSRRPQIIQLFSLQLPGYRRVSTGRPTPGK